MKNYNVLFAALIFGIFVGFAGFVINTPGGLTGYVTFEPTAETVTVGSVFSTSTNYTLNSTNITGLKVSGTLSDGTALVELVTANGKFLVWSGETTGETYTIVTDKESYALGGEISVTVTPADSTYTLWLTDDVGDKTVVQETFNIVIPGEYALDALINDSNNITKVSTSFTVRNDTNTSNDVPRIAEQPTAVFVDECVNSCEIEQTTGTLTLAITLSDGAVLDIESVTVLTPRANNAPTQVLTMPDITLNVGEPVIIDLNTYFTDADNDSLTYDFMSAPGVNMEV
ncbi:hypothetical protein GOV07_00400, partial [Candidatus Woesearchaeota archaeon]|nr:hypothetical protein [Candidatus Woesearchaeota archaeon]